MLFNKEGMLPEFLVWSCVLLFAIAMERYDGDSLLRTLYKNSFFCTKVLIMSSMVLYWSDFSGNHHYSRVSSQCNEYSVKIPVKARKRPLRIKLNSQVFLKICQIFVKPETDRFASHVSHQVPKYIAWMQDLFKQGTDAM